MTTDNIPAVEAEALVLSPEEREAIKAIRERKASGAAPQVGISELAQALVTAIEITRPKQKVHAYQRKRTCPICKQDPKTHIKLKRIWYQHGGIEMDPKIFCNEALELLNQVKPGVYCKGLVRVNKRKDRAYDISWPVATSAQRLRVMNEAGNTFEAILRRCIEEHADPARFKGPDDGDDD